MAPFDNVLMRQALAYAVNYDGIIAGVWGGGQHMDSVTPPLFGYAPAATKGTSDLEKAKALLAEAGYTDGLDIEIAVAQEWEPANLTLQVLPEEVDLAYEDEPFVWVHAMADRAAMKDTVEGWEYNSINGSAHVPPERMSLSS